MRRSKKKQAAEEEAADDTPEDAADAADGEGTEGPEHENDAVESKLDERLAPIEEFRSKSDSWMKETSAQLARISTHVQQDEKRQTALNDRLAEFEERLQSMLQLTEAVSMDQNPFVSGQQPGPPRGAAMPAGDREGPPAPDDGVVVVPIDEAGHTMDTPPPAAAGAAHPNDAAAEPEDPGPAPTPTDATPSANPNGNGNGDSAHQPGAEPSESKTRATSASRAMHDERERTPLDLEEPEDNPFFSGPSTLEPAPPPGSESDNEEDDDNGMDGKTPEGAPEGVPAPDDPSVEPPHVDDRPDDPVHRPGDSLELGDFAAREAERRLAFLQVASLLARHLRPLDIETFLECYTTADWLDHRDISKIRNLASDLSRNRRESLERIDREELHMRMILLVSRLARHMDRRPQRRLDKLARDTRKMNKADWLTGDP